MNFQYVENVRESRVKLKRRLLLKGMYRIRLYLFFSVRLPAIVVRSFRAANVHPTDGNLSSASRASGPRYLPDRVGTWVLRSTSFRTGAFPTRLAITFNGTTYRVRRRTRYRVDNENHRKIKNVNGHSSFLGTMNSVSVVMASNVIYRRFRFKNVISRFLICQRVRRQTRRIVLQGRLWGFFMHRVSSFKGDGLVLTFRLNGAFTRRIMDGWCLYRGCSFWVYGGVGLSSIRFFS